MSAANKPLTHFSGPLVVGPTTRLTSNTTLNATTDVFKTFVTDQAITITLPNADEGIHYTIIYDGKDGAGGVRIDVNTGDIIFFKGNIVADKYLENTTATSKKGDMITLSSGHHTSGWQPTAVRGEWAKEA